MIHDMNMRIDFSYEIHFIDFQMTIEKFMKCTKKDSNIHLLNYWINSNFWHKSYN